MLSGSEVDGREPIDDFSKLLMIISIVWFERAGNALLSGPESWIGLTVMLNEALTAEKLLTPDIQAT